MANFQYLLDTKVLSALIKQPAGNIAHKISQLDGSSFCTSIIVACELRYGIKKRASVNLTNKVEALLGNVIVLPLEATVDYHYANLRTALVNKGLPISAHDMLIAAHALALDLILVTGNEKEFRRIAGLKIENWFI